MYTDRVAKISFTVLAVAVCAWLIPTLANDGPSFRPDYVFQGSSIADFKTIGHATWKASNGEIVGTPTDASGGWLLLNRSLQNVGFYASVNCTGGCKTGILFRAEKTADGGMKGDFVSLTDTEQASFAVKLDAQGKEIDRQKLPETSYYAGAGAAAADAMITSMAARASMSVDRLMSFTPMAPPPGVTIPAEIKTPESVYHPGEWNEVGVTLYDDVISPGFNGGTILGTNHSGGKVTDETSDYGPIALYVGGTHEVHFKDLQYADLSRVRVPTERVSKNFRMQRLSSLYYSWGAQIADVNHDGTPDVIAGPYYYLGPNYTEAHEIYQPMPYNPATEYAQRSMVDLAYDFTGDGWPDVLEMSGNAGIGIGTLYVNPKGDARHWDHYVVLPHVGNEETLLKDIDGDGKPEVIFSYQDAFCYAKPDPEDPTAEWKITQITDKGPWGANIGHGLGVGDINGDGLMDLVTSYGWFEHPKKGSGTKFWTYHPQEFGRWGHHQGGPGGAEIGIYDVNGDGLNDIVTSMEGHGFGLSWYEQKRDAKGNISFVEHPIMTNFLDRNAAVMFTEPHSVTFADIDGDGIPDMITGKRAYSHTATFMDPDPFGPAVLYVFHTVRDSKAPGGARFQPELIHNMSGVGSHFAVGDLNGDGKPDIATSGAYGTFVFINNTPKAAVRANPSGH